MGYDVRDHFPGLAGGWCRFDGPAGTLPVDAAIDAVTGYLRSTAPACTGGTFAASRATDAVVADARVAVGELLGCGAEQVVFGPNATTLLFAFTRALARTWQPGDRIVCTQLDHDSNVRSWTQAAADAGAEVVFLPVDASTGLLPVEPLAALCADGRVRWVAVSGASNLTGVVPDLARVVAIAHDAGARVLVDGVARVPHVPTDVTALGLDALVTSPYKWYGPHAGVLVLHPDVLHGVEPYRVKPADYAGAERWETGMKSFEALAGVAAAARFLMADWPDAIAHEHELLARMDAGLRALPHVTVHVPPAEGRAPTTIFSVSGHRPLEVAEALAAAKVAVWSGDNYACELVDALGLREQGGAVRAGIVRYTSDADVDRLLDSVATLA